MASAIIETLGCPLDPDLLKSWERFSLESSHSYTSSDPSESADEETDVNHDTLIQQLKYISIDGGSDSKCVSSKCSDEITDINGRKKDDSEDLIILESEEENEENQLSSLPSLRNKELLKFAVEDDVKSVFCKSLNKNSEINSQKKNNTEKVDNRLVVDFVDNTEINENRFFSTSFENSKLLNNDYKSSSDASAEDESDSDNDQLEESVNLRERYPNRHNRSVNNRQQRTTPFPQNHPTTSMQHVYSNNSQISANYHSALNNFNVSHNGYEYFQPNSTPSERYNRTFSQYFPNSESVTDQAIGGIVSSLMADQIINGVFPCDMTDQIVNGSTPCDMTDQIVNGVISCDMTDQIVNDVIPCDMTDQIVNGVISYTAVGEVFDNVITSACDIRNVNDTFSAEINDVSYFNNQEEIIFPESIARDCAVTNEERFLDSHFDKTAEEVDYTLKCLTGSNSDSFPAQILLDLIKDNSVASTAEEISYPKSNQYNFGTESNGFHSSFSNINVEETSSKSNLAEENGILETSGELYGHECPANKSGNYSNIVSKNFTSINNECLSPATSNYNNVSEEIEIYIEDNSVASTSKEYSYPKSNHYNFGTESDGLHSFFSNIIVEETSSNSSLDEENGILGTSGELYGHECSANKSGNYSNIVSKNFTSINNECLSPETSDYNNVSEEIEIFISREQEIVQWEEMKEWVMKGQKNMPELPPPTTDNSWNMLPFVELNSNSILECVNAPECELPRKKKGPKSKRRNHSRKSACKAEEPKICRIWETAARDRLFHSASFFISEWQLEDKKMRLQIEKGELGTEKKKIIHFLKKNRRTKYTGTNLHCAIRSGDTEKVFCIVELHKECHGTTNEINLRDSCNKTVLDYSQELEMDLLTDYLKENDARNAVRA